LGSDRDHFVLTTRRNRRFIQSAETFQLLRCDAPESASHDGHDRSRSAAQRSAGQWPATSGKDTDQGLDAGHEVPFGRVMRFRGWDPSCSVCDRRRDGGGGDEETRTPDPLLAKEMLYQLSYVPAPGGGMVGDSGLEPETSALSGQRSNQLS
jgi:hypothetical protein